MYPGEKNVLAPIDMHAHELIMPKRVSHSRQTVIHGRDHAG